MDKNKHKTAKAIRKGIGKQLRFINLSGPPLGRTAKNLELQRAQRREERLDAKVRNRVEAVFGEGKRTYGLGMARLRETSETIIGMQL